MDKLVENMLYLNSTYSKENIIKRFRECLLEFNIVNFGVITRVLNYCTTLDFEDAQNIEFVYGAHSVTFKYESSNDLSEEDENNLKVILTSFIIAIENSVLYEGLMNKLDSKIISFTGSYEELLVDIEINTADYKRNNTPFSLIRIIYPKINKETICNSMLSGDITGNIKSCLRLSDKIYKDQLGLYILLRNTDLSGAKTVANKIKSKIANLEVGFATWKDSFIAIDLLGEAEDCIYMERFNNTNKPENKIEKLDKILNSAILLNDRISIVEDSVENSRFKVYQCLNILIKNKKYMVLRNPLCLPNDIIVYKFNYEDIAIDIINKIKKLD